MADPRIKTKVNPAQEMALVKYLDSAKRCCDSCAAHAEQEDYQVAFLHGWNAAFSNVKDAADEMVRK